MARMAKGESREPVSSSSYGSLNSSSRKYYNLNTPSSERGGCGCLLSIILLAIGIFIAAQRLGWFQNPPAVENGPVNAAPAEEPVSK